MSVKDKNSNKQINGLPKFLILLLIACLSVADLYFIILDINIFSVNNRQNVKKNEDVQRDTRKIFRKEIASQKNVEAPVVIPAVPINDLGVVK